MNQSPQELLHDPRFVRKMEINFYIGKLIEIAGRWEQTTDSLELLTVAKHLNELINKADEDEL